MVEELNKKSYVIIFGIIIIVFLIILASAILSKSISEANLAKRYLQSIQAFWLAEAGINSGLESLRYYSNQTIGNYNFSLSDFNFGDYNGSCRVNIIAAGSGNWTINSVGWTFYKGTYTNRSINATAIKYQKVPSNFYTNAIYSAGVVDIAGNSYSINGNVTTAYNITGNTNNINGSIYIDPSIRPLVHLNFEELKQMSIEQGNYHDSGNLSGPFPTSFFYNNTTPNIVFLEGNLKLKGNDKVGGFFVVGGDVVYDATLSGNVGVNGTIYTLGEVTINGGGSGLNINGGLWSGEGIEINGKVKIDYNQTYMQAIFNLNITTDVQIGYWKEIY